MKHFTNKILVVLTIGLFFLSSCSTNLFTGKRFDLDLVKVEKEKEVKRTPITPKEIENRELIIASNETTIPQLANPEPIYLNQEEEKQAKSSPNITKEKKYTSLKNKAVENIKSVFIPKKSENTNGSKEWDWASIVGISAGVLGLFILPILLGIVAIVFSAIGLSRTSGGKKKGRGLAIAGLVLGIIEVLLLFLLLTIILAAAAV